MITLKILNKCKREITNKLIHGNGRPISIIVRGLPGSGKSTLASFIADEFKMAHFESDYVHMHGGRYNFERNRHAQQAGALMHVACDQEGVMYDRVTSDVFPKILHPPHGVVITLQISKELSMKKNIHKCAEADIDRMIENWQPCEGELIFKIKE